MEAYSYEPQVSDLGRATEGLFKLQLCAHFFQILSRCLETLETDLFNLSRHLFENPELLSTDLPADLIRIQIRSKDQQDRLRSATAQLADRLEARSLRSKQVRKYRDVLSELEDWIEQTRCSVSAEIKFVSSKAFDLDVHILAVSSCWLKRARKPELSCKLASFMSDIITRLPELIQS